MKVQVFLLLVFSVSLALGQIWTVRENGKICAIKKVPVKPNHPMGPTPAPIYIRQCRPILVETLPTYPGIVPL